MGSNDEETSVSTGTKQKEACSSSQKQSTGESNSSSEEQTIKPETKEELQDDDPEINPDPPTKMEEKMDKMFNSDDYLAVDEIISAAVPKEEVGDRLAVRSLRPATARGHAHARTPHHQSAMALLARAPSLLHLQPLSIAAHAFLLPQTTPRPTLHCRPLSARVRASNSDPPQQVNLSRPPLHPRYLLLRAASARHRNWALGPTGFARFPLSYTRRGTIAGIPGLDESYLPRWIGLGFGALVLLNHLLSPSPTSAQLVEVGGSGAVPGRVLGSAALPREVP
ncbi:hypothetical protein ACQ4PT_016191 [Festuca glaucescens]